ncbi:MAG TPA: hypothetical protein VJ876_04360 [Bacteroidales bacterium]|nr:hypothetical protein [Bacteroidales bacterium]
MMKRIQVITMMTMALLMVGGMTAKAQVNPNSGQQQQSIEVSDSELQTFAKIMQKVQQEQKKSQGKMLEAIKNNGMEVKRYQEISRAKRQGQNVEMTDKEKKAYQSVQEVMKKEQQKMRQRMQSILKQHKMGRRRYIQISRALQQDKELQKRLQEASSKK